MKIEFDPVKNEKNIKERDLSFELVVHLDWGKALIWEDTRKNYREQRWYAWAPYGGTLYSVAFVMRGGITRIISFRQSNKKERKRYEEKKAGS